jgi:hypothetical protein
MPRFLPLDTAFSHRGAGFCADTIAEKTLLDAFSVIPRRAFCDEHHPEIQSGGSD